MLSFSRGMDFLSWYGGRLRTWASNVYRMSSLMLHLGDVPHPGVTATRIVPHFHKERRRLPESSNSSGTSPPQVDFLQFPGSMP